MTSLFEQYDLLASSNLFDAQYYLETNPDIAALHIDPLLHYVEIGAREGRNPHAHFDTRFYLSQCLARGERPTNPLHHFISVGMAAGLKTRPALPPSEPAPSAAGATTKRPRTMAAVKRDVARLFQGCLDALAADHRFEGWARVVGESFRQIEVAIVIDDDIVGTGRAQSFRRDLIDAGIAHGCFAFRIFVDQLAPGKRIEASLIERETQTLIDGPKSFIVPTTRLSPRIGLDEVLREVVDQETARTLLNTLETDFENFIAERDVETMVDYAYCYALGRYADSEGLAAYAHHLKSGNLRASTLISELLSSEEAKKYNKKLASALPDFLALRAGEA